MPTAFALRPILLFLHFLALAGALGTSAVLQHALGRLRSSRRTPEALDAIRALKALGQRMPLWALALFLTGAAVAQTSGMWGAPFVGAGIVGLALMLVVSGTVVRPRLVAAARRLAAAGDVAVEGDLKATACDPMLWVGALVNPAIAYAVMFDMVAKPGAVGCAAAIGVAIAGVIAVGAVARPATAAARVEAEAEGVT